MTNVICLQCFKDLRLLERAHRDWDLFHPAPSSSSTPPTKPPRGATRYPYQLEPGDQSAITYPDSDIR